MSSHNVGQHLSGKATGSLPGQVLAYGYFPSEVAQFCGVSLVKSSLP